MVLLLNLNMYSQEIKAESGNGEGLGTRLGREGVGLWAK